MKDVSAPKSAYPKAFSNFDASLASIDDMEGDISNMALPSGSLQLDTSFDFDGSFDDLLSAQSLKPSSPLEQRSRHSSIRTVNIQTPRGHTFKLKQSQASVYLTYPATADTNNSENTLDNYGRVEYELATKEQSMVVIVPNSRGLSENNQKLADAYATRTGCVTVVLDVYFDDPLTDTQGDQGEEEDEEADDSFFGKLKSLTLDLTVAVKRNFWLQSHSVFGVFDEEQGRFQTTSNWVAVQDAMNELLKTHGVKYAVVVGFSFGANVAARLAVEEESDVIRSVVLVHPIYMPMEITRVLKVPTFLIMGTADSFYSEEDITKLETDFKTKANKNLYKFTQMKLPPDTPHGFSIAGDYSPMRLKDLPTRTCEKIVTWILQKI